MEKHSYDAFGRRVAKNIDNLTPQSPTAIRYIYDGDDIVAEYDASGSLIRKYVNGPGIDEPICFTAYSIAPTTYWYHADGLGSITQITDDSGQITEQYKYDAYGNVQIYDSSHVLRPSSFVGNRYCFTGREFDSETGLYYYRARYYNSELGRFLQTDPVGYADSINLYQYCGNDPVNWVDPWGLLTDITILNILNLSHLPEIFNPGLNIHNFPGLVIDPDSIPIEDPQSPTYVTEDKCEGEGNEENQPKWPNTPEEMNELLGIDGIPLPDPPGKEDRNRVDWYPSDEIRITYEQHPYHDTTHIDPHWHLDTPGNKHQTFNPGDRIPGY